MNNDLEIIAFESQSDFEFWLEKNQGLTIGLWLRFYKKDSNIKSIIYDEALNVALCYGWIDGQLNKFDEVSYIQKFTPRRVKSMWSKRNVEKAIQLIKENKMRPSGLAEIEKAKLDGRWDKAYDSPGKMSVPDDFITKISKNEKAYSFFKTLNKTNLYTIGWRLQTAKTPEIRLKRMTLIIEKLEKEERFH